MAIRRSDQTEGIAILADTLTRGGAERQGYLLAEALTVQGHPAKVLSLWGGSKFTLTRSELSAEFPSTSVDCVAPRAIQFVALIYRRYLKSFFKKNRRRSHEPSLKQKAENQASSNPKLSTRLVAKVVLGRNKSNLSNILAQLMELDLSVAIETRLLLNYLKRHRSSLVISFLPGHNAIAVLACRALSIPVVVSERNDFLRQPVSGRFSWTRSTLYEHANLITANTEFAVQQIKDSLPNSRVIWQPNRQVFFSASGGTKEFVRDLYVISRLEEQKQIDSIIKALPILGASGIFPALNILGEGQDELRLRKLVSELGLDRQVNFRGYIPNAEIFGKGLTPGLFLSNSLYEGSSNSLHESVAAGLIPVVSKTVFEIHSILRPGLAESLVTRGTSEDIATKVYDLLQRQDLAQHLRDEALEDFNAYWNRREVALSQAMKVFIELNQKS